MVSARILRQRRLERANALADVDNVFPFFRLPLELREQIHEESFEDHDGPLQKPKDVACLRYRAQNMPALNLLQVSKEFKHEYEGRSHKTQSYHIEDTFDGRIEPGYQSPSPAVGSSHTVISIFVYPDDLEEELSMHRVWLLDLLSKLQTSASLRLNFKIARNSLRAVQVQLDDFVQELDKTSPRSLVVYVYGAERDENADTGLKNDFAALMMRRRGNDKLEDILGDNGKSASK